MTLKRYEILKDRLQELSQAQISYLFFPQKPYELLATYLAGEIRPTMSAKDLEYFIATLENIRVKNGSPGQTLGDLLKNKNLPLLKTSQTRSGLISDADYKEAIAYGKRAIAEYQAHEFSLGKDQHFLNDMMKIHDDFLAILDRVLYKANVADFPTPTMYNYSPTDLTSSQNLKDVEVTTQQPVLPNQGNLSFDAFRQGVSFNGQLLTATTEEEVKKAVEKITQEKVTTLGSKAYAIYHFGSQYLHAALVDEFAHTTTLQGKPITIGSTSGLVNIRTTPQGDVFIDVNTYLYMIMAEDNQKRQRMYIADTEGTSLAEISMNTPLGDQILTKQLPDRNLPHVRVPIGNMNGTFKLIPNEKNHYYLKAENLTIRYNGEQLENSHQLQAKQELRR